MTHLYAIDRNSLYYDLDDMQVDGKDALCAFWVADQGYYESTGHMQCHHVSKASGGFLEFPSNKFDEIQESGFISNMSEEDTKAWLESNGFVFSDKLQAIFTADE
jgi:hypothetical protein